MAANGMTAVAIASHFGISSQVASRWIDPEVDARHKERERARYRANKSKKLSQYRALVASTRTDQTLTYFAKCGEFVKIGRTHNVKQRLRKFQEGNPNEVILLATCDLDENDLHQQFSHLHHRGEWFKLNDELLEFINKL